MNAVFYAIKLFYIYFTSLLNDKKKAIKLFGPRTWCTKKPFGYQVAHHGYLLTSCPGH